MSQDTLHTPIRARVQFPQSITALDYAVPEQTSLIIGDFVLAELGRSAKVGVVTALSDQADSPIPQQPESGIRYKPILATFPHIPALDAAHIKYLTWLSEYYLASFGLACRLTFPAKEDFYRPYSGPKTYLASPKEPQKLGAKQQELYQKIIQHHGALPRTELLEDSNSSILKKLLDHGLIIETPWQAPKPIRNLAKLNPEQEIAFSAMRSHSEGGQVCLLDGTTGSGKTEVYFHLIAAALDAGQQVLVLLPEVSLLVDWQQRFLARFGYNPPAWHNGITPATRRKIWQKAATGQAEVIVGARSALHLPMQNLGLIIVDEEHDFSYKQEDGIPYHARDMAVVRGKIAKIPVVLASATPSLESLLNAQNQKYRHIDLPSRHQAASQPEIQLIDLNEHRLKASEWLSPPLLEALKETLEEKQQAVLFLNRRGFAPLLLCRGCGHRFDCPNCDVYLSEHLHPKPHLSCHHCAYRIPKPKQCPKCGLSTHLSSHGPGVERIIEDLTQDFPQARTFAATAETLNCPETIADFLHKMQNREIDIVVGTQIIAKGLDFPYLTLAGVIDADQALFGSNPRSAEQTWQLLHQIAGRTGRHHLAGRALLQTRKADDILFQSLQAMNRAAFIDQQSHVREMAKIPPFGRMAAFVVQSRDSRLAENTARTLANSCPNGEHRLLGPTIAPISKLRGWYRWRLLLMSPRHVSLQPIAARMLAASPPSYKVRIKIDVDPYNFV